MNESTFGAVFGGIYGAATGDRGWVAAMEGVAASFGTRLPVLHGFNQTDGRLLALELQHLSCAGNGARALIDLRRTRDDPAVCPHLSALVPCRALGAFGNAPQVVATLFDPEQQAPLDPFALAEAFALTPTEAKVAVRLTGGASAQSIAAEQGTAISTVRAHLRSLQVKFGLQRAIDILRVLRQGQSLWSAVPGSSSTGSATCRLS